MEQNRKTVRCKKSQEVTIASVFFCLLLWCFTIHLKNNFPGDIFEVVFRVLTLVLVWKIISSFNKSKIAYGNYRTVTGKERMTKAMHDNINYTDGNKREFENKLDYFLKEAENKYNEVTSRLGKGDKVTDNNEDLDLWISEDNIIVIEKWPVFKARLEDINGKYAKDIMKGKSGRIVKFEYRTAPISTLEKFCDLKKNHNFKKIQIEKKAPEPAPPKEPTMSEFFTALYNNKTMRE